LQKQLGLNIISHQDNIQDSDALNRMSGDMAISAKFFGLGEVNHGCAYLVPLPLLGLSSRSEHAAAVRARGISHRAGYLQLLASNEARNVFS
jgi:hypothetical protein